jgi:cytochrome c-type biogenesis protein CcmH/NrfG
MDDPARSRAVRPEGFTRRIFKVVLALGAVLVVVAIGTYIDAKPYQRERIWITVHDAVHPGEPRRLAQNKDAPAP